jgi:hypothetical protein
MPTYTVTVARTLTLTTSVTVRARQEDEAQDKVRAMIEENQFGTIAWEVEACQARVDDWQEDSDEIDIASVEEAQ